MRSDPYRHSVWIDVFGVLLLGGLLLGGAGYLLYEADGTTTRSTMNAYHQRTEALMARQQRRAAQRRRSRTGPRRPGGTLSLPDSEPLLARRPGPTNAPAVPFSEGWREQTTAALTRSSSASGDERNGGRMASLRSGPAVASARSSGELGIESRRRSEKNAGADAGSRWRAEVQQLAVRTRALSSEIARLDREASRSQDEGTSQDGAAGTTAGARTSDRDVPSPPDVPIDDHLHWLLALGLLWGVWRLS